VKFAKSSPVSVRCPRAFSMVKRGLTFCDRKEWAKQAGARGAGKCRFGWLSALRDHAEAPYKADLRWETRRALHRPPPPGAGPDGGDEQAVGLLEQDLADGAGVVAQEGACVTRPLAPPYSVHTVLLKVESYHDPIVAQEGACARRAAPSGGGGGRLVGKWHVKSVM
jgi:hypothetical protein